MASYPSLWQLLHRVGKWGRHAFSEADSVIALIGMRLHDMCITLAWTLLVREGAGYASHFFMTLLAATQLSCKRLWIYNTKVFTYSSFIELSCALHALD